MSRPHTITPTQQVRETVAIALSRRDVIALAGTAALLPLTSACNSETSSSQIRGEERT